MDTRCWTCEAVVDFDTSKHDTHRLLCSKCDNILTDLFTPIFKTIQRTLEFQYEISQLCLYLTCFTEEIAHQLETRIISTLDIKYSEFKQIGEYYIYFYRKDHIKAGVVKFSDDYFWLNMPFELVKIKNSFDVHNKYKHIDKQTVISRCAYCRRRLLAVVHARMQHDNVCCKTCSERVGSILKYHIPYIRNISKLKTHFEVGAGKLIVEIKDIAFHTDEDVVVEKINQHFREYQGYIKLYQGVTCVQYPRVTHRSYSEGVYYRKTLYIHIPMRIETPRTLFTLALNQAILPNGSSILPNELIDKLLIGEPLYALRFMNIHE